MGMINQNVMADISTGIRQGEKEGIQITSGKILEDYQITDEFVFIFPAEPINGLKGQFILTLRVQSVDPTTPGILRIRRVWMVKSREQVSVMVEMKVNASVNERWAYTRHPDVRLVYNALFDDPDTVLEGKVFHQSVFPFQPSKYRQLGIEAGWSTVEFVLVSQLIEHSRLIDYCEMLLEALNEKFTAKTGYYLHWTKSLVTHQGIETGASEMENRLLQTGELLSFNVTIEWDSHEITRKKRIQAMIKHSLTLILENGTRQAGTIGISVSK
jgi:hypothetical protein